MKHGFIRFEDLAVSRKGHPNSDFSLQAKFLEVNIEKERTSLIALLKKLSSKEAWFDSFQLHNGFLQIELKQSSDVQRFSGFNKISIKELFLDIIDSRPELKVNSLVQKNFEKTVLPSIHLMKVETTAPVALKTIVRDILLHSNVDGNIGNAGSFQIRNNQQLASSSLLWKWKGARVPIGAATTLYAAPPLAWIDSGNADVDVECFAETQERLKVVIDMKLYEFHCREPSNEEVTGLTFSSKASGRKGYIFLVERSCACCVYEWKSCTSITRRSIAAS